MRAQMKLSEKQQQFTRCLAKLVTYAYEQGYGLTLGDAYRDPRVHGTFGTQEAYGSKHSMHKMRLAQDYNLFVCGRYIDDSSHPAWDELGRYWKSLHPDAAWGGDFKIRDCVHFSFMHNGFQ
jgi:hypothetical protein